jgi:uncharacterized protein (DUF58 family)
MMLGQRLKKLGLKFSRHNRVYIFPTSYGIYFAALIFVMFLISLTYGNNTLMLITFLLLSQFILFMLWAHFNLKYIAIESIFSQPLFARSKGRIDLQLYNSAFLDQNEIAVGNIYQYMQMSQNKLSSFKKKSLDYLNLNIIFEERGISMIKQWELTSQYPLGLFKTWKYFTLPTSILVYPELKGISLVEYFNLSRRDESSNFEFDKHIKYELNPKSNQIDWKIFAKSDELLVRQYVNEDFESLHFEFNPTGTELERYISQMAFWIVEAQRLNYQWSFSSIDLSLPDGKSQEKYLKVLEYLACYPK